MRRRPDLDVEVTVAAADPLNLVGIVVPGERVAAVPGKTVAFVNGVVAGQSLTGTGTDNTALVSDEVVVAGLFPVPPEILRQSSLERPGV
jgi:ATP-dependent Lhr-like helicase